MGDASILRAVVCFFSSGVAMDRRSFLWGLAGAGVLLYGAPLARALDRTRALRRADVSALGVTLHLGLDAAPFPCDGAPYTDDTVVVFVPAGWRPGPGDSVDLLVHFLGRNGRVDGVLEGMRVREQLAASRRNAWLVLPQGPVNAPDNRIGKLERPGGLARLVAEVIERVCSGEAADALGSLAPDGLLGPGRVLLSAHSGGYRAAAWGLTRGQVEVSEVFLFDALYGERRTFREWLTAAPGVAAASRRRLVSVYTAWGGTRDENHGLQADLERLGLAVRHDVMAGPLSRDERARATALFLQSSAGHGDAVWRDDALFTCLASSGLAAVDGAGDLS